MVARGHELDFFTESSEIQLEKYGVRSYENVIVFSPHKKLGKLQAELTSFVENGGNILLSSR
jgi:hypothetical protein